MGINTKKLNELITLGREIAEEIDNYLTWQKRLSNRLYHGKSVRREMNSAWEKIRKNLNYSGEPGLIMDYHGEHIDIYEADHDVVVVRSAREGDVRIRIRPQYSPALARQRRLQLLVRRERRLISLASSMVDEMSNGARIGDKFSRLADLRKEVLAEIVKLLNEGGPATINVGEALRNSLENKVVRDAYNGDWYVLDLEGKHLSLTDPGRARFVLTNVNS